MRSLQHQGLQAPLLPESNVGIVAQQFMLPRLPDSLLHFVDDRCHAFMERPGHFEGEFFVCHACLVKSGNPAAQQNAHAPERSGPRRGSRRRLDASPPSVQYAPIARAHHEIGGQNGPTCSSVGADVPCAAPAARRGTWPSRPWPGSPGQGPIRSPTASRKAVRANKLDTSHPTAAAKGRTAGRTALGDLVGAQQKSAPKGAYVFGSWRRGCPPTPCRSPAGIGLADC